MIKKIINLVQKCQLNKMFKETLENKFKKFKCIITWQKFQNHKHLLMNKKSNKKLKTKNKMKMIKVIEII